MLWLTLIHVSKRGSCSYFVPKMPDAELSGTDKFQIGHVFVHEIVWQIDIYI